MEKELTTKEKLKAKAKSSALKFKKELKRSITTAIIAALGFIIALSWRDLITEWVKKITEMSPVQSSLISAIVVTIIAVIGILIISLFNHEKE